MNQIIRVSLVCLISVCLVTASAQATSHIEDGNNDEPSQIGSEWGAVSDCPQLPRSFGPTGMQGKELLSWSGKPAPVLEAGPAGSWDEIGVIGPEVLRMGDDYRMWYTGISGSTYQIGAATSKDGLVWEKYAANPVLTVGEAGSWDEQYVWAPAVLHYSSTWEMWYVGYSGATGSQIGYATSQDGVNWVKYGGNPVLSASFFDAWESSGLISPHVLYENGRYHMWYSNNPHGYIGYAVSSDGIHWERYPENPLIEPSGGDDENCGMVNYVSPSILHLDQYHMWYQAGQLCRGDTGGYWIVHSTSPDGITWSDPEWAYGMGEYGMNAHYPTVISRQNGLIKQMWYVSCCKIYYAEEDLLDIQIFLPLTMQ